MFHTKMNCQTIFILLFVLHFASLSSATLSQGDKKKKKSDKVKTTSAESVSARGLVNEKVKATDIVREHAAYCHTESGVRHVTGDTLAYVTPWNNHGYDVAKLFSRKFTYVSPVWLQVVRRSGQYLIQGTHDVDLGWSAEVKKGGSMLVPRVLFDGWTGNDFHILFTSEQEQQDCIETLLHTVQEYKFDGLVLEVWSQLGRDRHSELLHFIGHVYETFQKNRVKLIVVIPPPVYPRTDSETGLISRDDFTSLVSMVDAVSLMTYDYSNPNSPGPNSPVDWIKKNVEYLSPDSSSSDRKKILLGLNFYGNDFLTPRGGGTIIGSQYIQLLSKHKPKLQWNEEVAEHVIKYRGVDGEHVVYYPTLKSLSVRLALAQQLGTGLSIWEIGQGLDYFYDLL